jgi:hypothetical protein
MTTEEIIEKYPKIFAPYEGNPRGVNWHGVPKGWLPIIDKLCGSIQSYIDNYAELIENPDYIKDSVWIAEDASTHKFIKKKPAQMTCIQMKEKFGGLRFYIENGNSEINGMIKMAEYLCNNTCESCGTEEGLGFTKGWISVRCKPCADAAGKVWLSKEDWYKQWPKL